MSNPADLFPSSVPETRWEAPLVEKVGAPLEIQGLLEVTLRGLLQMLRAEEGSISWLDPSGQELVVTAAFGSKAARALGYRQPLGQGVAGKVAVSRQPLLVRDVAADQILTQRNHYRTRSFLCVPLQTPHELYGVVNLTDKITGEVFTTHDLERTLQVVSQLALALQALRQSTDLRRQIDLAEKFSAMGRLAGGLVHELSNPLDGVNRYANLLLDMTPEGHLRDYLLQIKAGLARMTATVRTLGQLARQPSESRAVLDVNQAVEDTLASLGLPFGYPEVTVRRHFAPDLPRIPDYGFSQVVSNLVKNACDAMLAGGVLTLSTQRTKTHLLLRVADTGVGIPPEQHAAIFEPFFTTKPQGQGIGLGLAIAQEITTRYQGTISVESEVGRGTTFWVYLPLP